MKLKSNTPPGGKAYQCSMKCEGEKTYNSPGNCPECNMKLVKIDK